MVADIPRAEFAVDGPSEPDGQQQQRRLSTTNKRKRSRERSRVTRACDRCKRYVGLESNDDRDGLCSKGWANVVVQTEDACTYNASYNRGRMPPTSRRVETEELEDAESHVLIPADAAHGDGNLDSTNGNMLQPPGAALVTASSRVSPEPSQTDLQGHYIGPASGVSFLLRVQKRLHQAVTFSQASSIFTFGDAPLPEPDPASCLLMSRDEGQKLLERYFDFAVPTHRFLHRPTTQQWLDEFFSTRGVMIDQEEASARKAVLFMVFAQAQVYTPGSSVADESARYYLAADQYLSKERGSIRLTSVQARLAQCFYLLGQSRINHCWSLFGTMAHLALAIGLNRNRRGYPSADIDRVEAECRRRTFWCAYSLDSYLSAALGRPRTFHDDDIDQELPSNIEDTDLIGEAHLPRHSQPKQSLMLAPVAHVKLSRIISAILRDLYSIKPVSASRRTTLAAKHTSALKDWRKDISYFLDVKGISASFLKPIYQRQTNVLNFAYWHAMILTNRPFLLSNFARLQQAASSSAEAAQKARTNANVQECLQAAMNIVETVNALFQADQMFRGYWFTLYFAFSAVVILYVYVIQQKGSPIDVYQTYLEAANTCQGQILAIAEQGSLTQRYCLVLEELRIEALRQTTGVGMMPMPDALPLSDSALATGAGADVMSPTFHQLGLTFAEGDVNWNASPSSSVADITSWGHFDSLVSSGFGGLEALFSDETLSSFQPPPIG
ncbi:fungal specific transcription factor domain-containing protein [Seiridium cupressi]